ncbi:MAG: ABC transporter ATP-binding protein [Alphaproteobacteria bacterium]
MRKAIYRLFFDAETRGLATRLIREHVIIYRCRFGVALIFMVLAAAATTALPYLLKPVFDDVFTSGNPALLAAFCGAVLLAFLLKGAASYGEAVTMTYVGQRIISDVQNRLFQHLMTADLAFFHGTTSGDLISYFTNDINQMRNAVATALVGIGKDAVTTVFLIGLMFNRDWVLASIAFLVFPIAILPIAKIGRRMRHVAGSTQAEMSTFTSQLSQVFQGMRVVKAYGMEAYEAQKARDLIERLFALIYKSSRIRSASHPIIESLGGFAIMGVIGYGGWQVMHESRTTGEFLSFILALLLVYEPLKRLSNLNANLQEGLAAATRVFRIIDTVPTIRDPIDAREIAPIKQHLVFDNVTFAYPNGRKAIKGINLTIPAGKTVALVGPSGAGKSTLINLIARFYDSSEGTIRIDDIDITTVTIQTLRSQIALVSQEVILFDDTIHNNIAYGNARANEADILAASCAAAADEFIQRFPQKYDTIVGENGVKLSGGQRQRLAIARAMLKNAPILLLDEATSALDTDSERQVQAALKVLMQGRTTVMVAHRLSTVVEADTIYVLDHGCIVEEGSHQQLLQQNGVYARLWQAQSTHPIAV